MLRRVRGLVVVLAVVSLAACSSDEASDGGAVTTAEATTTTTEASTTTESTEPDPEWTPEELEVIEAWEEYRAFWDVVVEDLDAALDLAPEVMEGGQLESFVSQVAVLQENEETLRGSSVFALTDVTVAGATATVTECGVGAIESIARDGEVVVPAGTESVVGEVMLERGEDGEWRVAGRRTSGSC